MTSPVDPVTLRSPHGPEEYPVLVDIWRSAVLATHDFLAEEDFVRIEANLADSYFPAVRLVVAERAGVPVGFAGTAEGNLEMLFVADSARGTGVGSLLLDHTLATGEVQRVDVNEHNTRAHAFYLRRGFVQTGRTELDGEGRPYPLLHLELSHPLRREAGDHAGRPAAR